MKILIVRPTPNKVNLNTYNLQEIGLAKALVRKGHCCDIMYYCGKEPDHKQSITFDEKLFFNILWLHGFGILREGIYPSLKKYLHQYDIIQVGGYIGLTSWWLNRYYGNKVVNYQGPYYYENNHGDILRARIWDSTLLKLLAKNKMIVATKSVLATEYIKTKGIQNVRTVGVGLDKENLIKQDVKIEQHEFVEKMYEQKGNDKYILYIGVLEERRNILFTLKVFEKILKLSPNYKLVLIGNGKEEYVKQCQDLMNQLKIENKILICSRLEQKYMKAVYECSDAFILPTRYEIFGMVLLEAMYFGLPVFTTYNGGSSTMIHEKNGIVLNDLDEDRWAQKIVSVLNDDDLCARYGNDARKTIEEKFTWDALADKFIEVYLERIRGNVEKD